jgi:two-component system, OmpR family, sensor histidine kinase KdpD
MESERLHNSLLTAISHDIRTPLTALVGLAETLSQELTPVGSEHADKADAIRSQSFRIRRLVENLLEMARLKSSELKLRKDWQSIEEIIGSALKALEPSMVESGSAERPKPSRARSPPFRSS